MIRFLIDEDCPISLVQAFVQHGFDAVHITRVGLSGIKDPELFIWAQRENRIILSRDMGWANIITYPPGTHEGIVVLRLPYTAVTQTIYEAVYRFLQAVDYEKLPGALVIVEKDRFRLRVDVL